MSRIAIADAVVVAAGSSRRMGGQDKLDASIAGLSLLGWAVRAMAAAPEVADIIVVTTEERAEHLRAADWLASLRARPVIGGPRRQDSVAAGVREARADVVLVHDAARPLVPEELVTAVVAAVRAGHPAVVPGLPVVDTIKRVDAASDVEATIDRSTLRAIQTPQGFERSVLQQAHAVADLDAAAATDDAGLVERLGLTVHVIPGHEEAFKVTRPFDVVMAEAVLARRRAAGAV